MRTTFTSKKQLLTFIATVMGISTHSHLPALADDMPKPSVEQQSTEVPAERVLEILQTLEGEWEYKDNFYRGCTLRFKQFEVGKGDDINEKLNVTTLGDITQVHPLGVDMFGASFTAKVVGPRLVLQQLSKDNVDRIEIFMANKISDRTEKIRVRILFSKNKPMLWYQSGSIITLTRVKKEGVVAPSPSK